LCTPSSQTQGRRSIALSLDNSQAPEPRMQEQKGESLIAIIRDLQFQNWGFIPN